MHPTWRRDLTLSSMRSPHLVYIKNYVLTYLTEKKLRRQKARDTALELWLSMILPRLVFDDTQAVCGAGWRSSVPAVANSSDR